MPKEFPEIKNLYCLRHVWKDLNVNQQANLIKDLKKHFALYIYEYEDNRYFHNESSHALCICPDRHSHTNSRIISIQDPRNGRKGVVCLKFHNRHGTSYYNLVDGAKNAYSEFRRLEVSTQQELDRIKNKSVALQLLIKAGFYRIVFEQSKDIQKINKAFKQQYQKQAHENYE